MITARELTERLERHYSAQANDEGRKFPIRSSAMGKCPRELSSLLARRETNPFTYKAGRTFEDGHDRGRSLAKALDGVGVELEREIWTTIPGVKDPGAVVRRAYGATADGFAGDRSLRVNFDRLQVRGRADWVKFSADGAHADIVDFKGKNSFGMKKLPEEGVGRDYEVQVHMYAAGLAEGGIVLDSAHVLFENKDTQEWMPIQVQLDDTAARDRALAEVASILNAFAAGGFTGDEGTPMYAQLGGKLPWQCNYCAVGPKVGNCAAGRTIIDDRKPGALMPAWRIL